MALFIIGALLTLAGIVFIFLGRFDDRPQKEEDSLSVGDVLERLDHALTKIEKRYRWGLVMTALGLGLVAGAAWVAAMQIATTAAPPPPPAGG